MSTAMPAGEGSLTSDTTRSEVDPETAPTTGLEPDTAADAAGAQETTPADENAVEPTPDEENSAVESTAPLRGDCSTHGARRTGPGEPGNAPGHRRSAVQ